MNRNRLAFVLPDFTGGGAERVALNLITDFVGRGYEVDLVLLEARGELLDLLPPAVRVFDLKVSRIRSAVGPLCRYFKERQPFGVQVSMWPVTIVAIAAHRLARSRANLVISDHIQLSKQYGAFPVKSVMKASMRLLYPLADSRVIVSAEAADDLARLSEIPRDRIEVIYNPISAPPTIATNPEAEAAWGGAEKRIITVGKLKDQKNQALLIRSFAILRRSVEAKLMIVGEGPLLAELQAVALAERVEGDVLFPGFTLDPWPYYASADLFVLSSDYEGFGNVLVEAMYAGLPIVSTDCESGPREILDGGRFGRLVPVGDEVALAEAMVAALDYPHDPAALRARAEVVSGRSTSDRYLELMLGTRP